MSNRLEVDNDHPRHEFSYSCDVADVHDQGFASAEPGTTAVYDRRARPEPCDRRRDFIAPDRIARDVGVVEHEAAYRAEFPGKRSVSVLAACARDRNASPTGRG